MFRTANLGAKGAVSIIIFFQDLPRDTNTIEKPSGWFRWSEVWLNSLIILVLDYLDKSIGAL